MSFVRTVLGDIDAQDLGITYSHEHLIIDGGRPVQMHPDFDLSDADRLAEEIIDAKTLGLQALIDAMPADAGRNVSKLADLSRRTGVHIVAPTGLHHDRYYGPAHWSHRVTDDDLADLFEADVVDGIDELDYSGPVVRRTAHRAGVIKIAGSEGGPSERDARVFRAAAEVQRRTGVPILTHCEGGTGALEQVRVLVDAGARADHVVLSHVDKIIDPGYHRELLATGATAEYDQAFRWADRRNGTIELLGAMVAEGFGDRIVLGMDAARQGYYRVFGGTPGLRYLLGEFATMMAEHGLGGDVQRRFFVDNPARVFAFASAASSSAHGGATGTPRLQP